MINRKSNFILLVILSSINCYNILIYNPRIGYSHVNFMGKIADAIVEAGHNVTVLQPVMHPELTFTGSTKARVIEIIVAPDEVEEIHRRHNEMLEQIWTLPAGHPFGVIAPVPLLSKGFSTACREILSMNELFDELKSQKFDVGITELFDFAAFAYFHEINLTNIIATQSVGLTELSSIFAGVPVLPSYIPAGMGVTTDDTSFSVRVINTIFTLLSYYYEYAIANAIQGVMDEKYGDKAPSIWDQIVNITWTFTNSEPLIDFPKPTLHTIVDLEGIGVATPKPLNKEWDDILNLRPKTVLVSFGSIAPSILMTSEMKMNLIKNFALYPDVTFIWKYEKPEDKISQGVDNIIISKWTPQTDLLADPRLSAFITHGGIGSIFEAATYGKPLLVIPIFGDQSRNAHMVVRLGMAVLYEKAELSSEELFYAVLKRLLEDQRLPEAAIRIKNLLASRPITAQQKVVSTIDMACSFGPQPLLRPAGVSLGYITYYNIDVLLLLFFIIMVIISLPVSFILYIVKRLCLCGTKKSKKE